MRARFRSALARVKDVSIVLRSLPRARAGQSRVRRGGGGEGGGFAASPRDVRV